MNFHFLSDQRFEVEIVKTYLYKTTANRSWTCQQWPTNQRTEDWNETRKPWKYQRKLESFDETALNPDKDLHAVFFGTLLTYSGSLKSHTNYNLNTKCLRKSMVLSFSFTFAIDTRMRCHYTGETERIW